MDERFVPKMEGKLFFRGAYRLSGRGAPNIGAEAPLLVGPVYK